MFSSPVLQNAKYYLICGPSLLLISSAFWTLYMLAPRFNDGYFSGAMFGTMGFLLTARGVVHLLLPAKKTVFAPPVQEVEAPIVSGRTRELPGLQEMGVEAPEKVTF